ncbi:MAG: SUMF1/EgtB/PvdO family nonheme iron enzyme, partial [Pirellulaceae bacterium]
AWQRFVKMYAPLIFHWGKNQGLSAADATDLVQEVMAILVTKLPEFQYDPTQRFRGWLRTVTVNAARNLHRRESTRPWTNVVESIERVSGTDAVELFDEASKKHQQSWSEYLGVPVKKDVDLGGGVKITMALIPPGEFLMGSNDEERTRWLKVATAAKDQPAIDRIPSEAPQHRVRLTKPFYLAMHEVTQEQYQRVMGANPSHFSSSGDGKDQVAGQFTHRHPVETVSWFDGVSFCNKLSALQKRRPCYVTSGSSVIRVPGNGYRLPSEAEWEYACRAGTTGAFYDESELGNYAWYNSNSGSRTHPVGEKLPNGFGVYDMYGNVWESCWDWYDAKYYEQLRGGRDVVDPLGPAAGAGRVFRGGNWLFHAGRCRSANRFNLSPHERGGSLGFRLASVLVEE